VTTKLKKGFLGNSIVFIFLDGLGIGVSDSHVNPIARLKKEIFPHGEDQLWSLPFDGIARRVDAQLGMPGLPQSATGQTTLFTGRNAAQAIGRHLPGFPTPTLKQIIHESSIFRRISDLGGRVTFANCYSPGFFRKPPRWVSVTTSMCQSSGTPFRTIKDLEEGKGLFFDFTNEILRARGMQVELFSPFRSAGVLAYLTGEFDFCLYENFVPDLIGHRLGMAEAYSHLIQLEEFLVSLLEVVDLGRVSVLVTSDHGNLEDMTNGTHTSNPVPCMVWGPLCQEFKNLEERLSLCDITPKIVRFLENLD
jgi:hypothetical protein